MPGRKTWPLEPGELSKILKSSLSSSDCTANVAVQFFFRAFLWPETTHKIPSVFGSKLLLGGLLWSWISWLERELVWILEKDFFGIYRLVRQHLCCTRGTIAWAISVACLRVVPGGWGTSIVRWLEIKEGILVPVLGYRALGPVMYRPVGKSVWNFRHNFVYVGYHGGWIMHQLMWYNYKTLVLQYSLTILVINDWWMQSLVGWF